ncbi:MAG: hypothetical protein FWF95_05400 [Syntrophorhabdaceae bacterium]|nr:hypothetical protein [Syntrophorhabdaceae bacterium]
MGEILDSLSNAKIVDLAQDIRVIFAAGVLFVLAMFFRWKSVLLLLFASAGAVTILRYMNMKEGAAIDHSIMYLAFGTIAIFVVLIYFMFIRSD